MRGVRHVHENGRLKYGPRDSPRLFRPDSGHGYKSWWCLHPCGPAIPVRCECRSPLPAHASRNCAGTCAACACNGSASVAGSIVTRSFAPLPSRTVICRIPKSASLTRSRTPSISRIPVPYKSRAKVPKVPSSRFNTSPVSWAVNTVGSRCGRFARSITPDPIHIGPLGAKTVMP
jgi:hypothetical protein